MAKPEATNPAFLIENDVVDAVGAYLESIGWTDVVCRQSNQRGHDLEARLGDRSLRVEAKGGGSARATSKRFGEQFQRKQVYSHVGVAVVCALRWVAAGAVHPAVAFPDNADHRAEVRAMQPVLAKLNATVFWVADEPTVNVKGAPLPTA